MKKMVTMSLALLMLLCLAACGHEHTWAEATCSEPKTCTECGETEGEALGHDWKDATCTEPRTCSRCKETEGKALGHDWKDATCTEPKTCSRCGETEGEAPGHKVETWETTKEATCTEVGEKSGVCTVCKETVKEEIPMVEHTPGDWEIKTAATESSAGVRVKKCTVCGKELENESYTMTPEEIKQAYIAQCQTYTYDQLARNPDQYDGSYAKLRGEVMQVQEDGDSYVLLVQITQKRYYWDDQIMVYYTRKDSSEGRILEDDIVTLYGKMRGTYTYTSVMNAAITVPLMYAEYIDH